MNEIRKQPFGCFLFQTILIDKILKIWYNINEKRESCLKIKKKTFFRQKLRKAITRLHQGFGGQEERDKRAE